MSALVLRSPSERRREALKFLAIARQVGDSDAGIGVVYLKGTEDLDPGVLERVCEQLGKEPRAEFAPTMPDLGTIRRRCEELARRDAEHVAASKVLPLPAHLDDHDPRTWVYCSDCRDESSGWREMFCTGGGERKDETARPVDFKTPIYYCGRKVQHPPHAYTERCACYATNPVIAARRDAQAKRAAARSDQ